MASQFPGAVVLRHDSQGVCCLDPNTNKKILTLLKHCSYSNPSICTAKIVREYFQTGKLPQVGTTCTPEWRPFLGCTNKDETGNCMKLNEEDDKLLQTQLGLTEVWP